MFKIGIDLIIFQYYISVYYINNEINNILDFYE